MPTQTLLQLSRLWPLMILGLLFHTACITPFPSRDGWPCVTQQDCGALQCVNHRCREEQGAGEGVPDASSPDKTPDASSPEGGGDGQDSIPEQSTDAVVIRLIKGDGSSQTPTDPSGNPLPGDAKLSPTRFRKFWILEGQRLLRLERCQITRTKPNTPQVTIDLQFEDGGTDQMRRVDLSQLKPALVAGMFALTCLVGGVSQSFGQVYVLQGEPGTGINQDTADRLKALLPYLELLKKHLEVKTETKGSVDGARLTVRKANLHVENAAPADQGGKTDVSNGFGNVIVGYNEEKQGVTYSRAGSHNIVVGQHHEYTSHSGLVSGESNHIEAPTAAVTGGSNNVAKARGAVIAGGSGNTASGEFSSVAGGFNNTAEGKWSSVVAGTENKASGEYSSVTGGLRNVAEGKYSTIAGGESNTTRGISSHISGGGGPNGGNVAYGTHSVVVGGRNNATGVSSGSIGGVAAVVLGGQGNTAIGSFSSIVGGGGAVASKANKTFAAYSTILGGLSNVVGLQTDETTGLNSSIVGGTMNQVSGEASVVVSGINNKIPSKTTKGAVILGGNNNTASGDNSSVCGGNTNKVEGEDSVIVGGTSQTISSTNTQKVCYPAISTCQ